MRITGHERLRDRLKRLYQDNAVPHALIFSGLRGIGKRLVARELSRGFYCLQGRPYGGCRSCDGCRLFDLGNVPDFVELDCRDKERWQTAQIKELLARLSLRSFSGTRIVLIDNADFMPLPAANALLKSLEEPRPGTFYVLIASGTQKIVPTIVSRCQKWFFDPLSEASIEQILKQKEYPSGLIKDLLILSEGSLEHIEDFSQSIDVWRDIKETIEAIGSGDEALGLRFSSSYGRDKERLSSDFGLMRLAARILLHSEQGVFNKKKWAAYLSNILEAERLIFERHFSPASLLSVVHSNLALAGRVSGSFKERIWQPLYISDMDL